jgi:hypothetical protein
MTLEIKPQLRERLRQCLREGLPKLTTSNNFSIDTTTTPYLLKAQQAMPDKGAVANELSSMFGSSFSLISFVNYWLSERLRDECDFDLESSRKALIDLEPFKDVDQVIDQLLNALCSLPYTYDVFTPLNEQLSTLLKTLPERIELGGGVELCSGSHLRNSGPKLKNPNEKRNSRISPNRLSLLLLDRNDYEWDDNTFYISIRSRGFIDEFGGSETFDNITALLKAFFGLAVAVGIIAPPQRFAPKIPMSTRHFICRRDEDNNAYIEYATEIHPDLRGVISDVLLADAVTGASDPQSSLLQRIMFMRSPFLDQKRFAKILRASRWLMDSFTHHNEALSYVQRTVCLEILLGDKSISEDVGIGKLLASRCAYLVAKNLGERDQILREFPEIYNIRSKIIHEGASRISGDEWHFEGKIRRLCNMVIWRELDLIRQEYLEKDGLTSE